MSPPTRGAWIETSLPVLETDRRFGRPPRGGRGLKRLRRGADCAGLGRPPRGGRGLKQFPSAFSMLST